MRKQLASVAVGVALALPFTMANTKCGADSSSYWMVAGQVKVGGAQPAGGYYQLGTNSAGKPFWVRRGSEADHILNPRNRAECCDICGGPVLTFGGVKKCLSEGKHAGILAQQRKGGASSKKSREAGAKNLRKKGTRGKRTPKPTPKPSS